MKREAAKSNAVIDRLTPFDILKEEIAKKDVAMQAKDAAIQAMLEESAKREAAMKEEAAKKEAAMIEEAAKREAAMREEAAIRETAMKEEAAKREANEKKLEEMGEQLKLLTQAILNKDKE